MPTKTGSHSAGPEHALRAGATPLPLGSSRCLCRACGAYFTTTRNFECHRRNGACVDPAAVGLIQRAGIWSRPPPGGLSPSTQSTNSASVATAAGLDAVWHEGDRDECSPGGVDPINQARRVAG